MAAAFGLGALDASVRPRGFRVLHRLPRLPESVRSALVSHFGDFQKMLNATVGDLDQVEGVGRTRAQQLRHFFDQLLASTPRWDFFED